MLLLVTGGAVLIGTMPAALAAGDPPWLDRALGVSRARVGAARATAAVLYAQGLLVLLLSRCSSEKASRLWCRCFSPSSWWW